MWPANKAASPILLTCQIPPCRQNECRYAFAAGAGRANAAGASIALGCRGTISIPERGFSSAAGRRLAQAFRRAREWSSRSRQAAGAHKLFAAEGGTPMAGGGCGGHGPRLCEWLAWRRWRRGGPARCLLGILVAPSRSRTASHLTARPGPARPVVSGLGWFLGPDLTASILPRMAANGSWPGTASPASSRTRRPTRLRASVRKCPTFSREPA